ncbi:hypothetical protein [Bradyrhizobium oligotrophicum]|uniref:hypothetical protein n=1 Tax=Bradyrhizobium oligotrophicum TaxID=44255 RepID=UPI0005A9D4B4|nr:hypothetical protein [Bradyrhizobium oligotrophicum]
MYLFVWFLLGASFAWSLAATWTAIRSFFFGYSGIPAEIRWSIALIGLCSLAALAIASDNAMLSQDFLDLRSHFLGPRFEVLLLGFIIGVITFGYRWALHAGLKRLGSAILGDKDSTAWAFQSAIALVMVAFVVFAVRPDFLDYLRSFKIGGFEATFAEPSSSAIRDTNLHLNDQREALTVVQFKDFEAEFIDPTSPRGFARRLFAPAELIDQTDPITVLLVDGYLRPVTASLNCLYEAHQLDIVSRDDDIASFVYAWQGFLLAVHQGEVWKDGEDQTSRREAVTSILARLLKHQLSIVRHANQISRDCVSRDRGPKDAMRFESKCLLSRAGPDSLCLAPKMSLVDLIESYDAAKSKDNSDGTQWIAAHAARDFECLDAHFRAAQTVLKSKGQNPHQIISLMVMDAYLAGAVADLIALVSGQQKDKAVFLTTMLDGFPQSQEFATPGTINVFYQLSDARWKTLDSWPLEQTLSDFRFAFDGVKAMMNPRPDQLIMALGKRVTSNQSGPDPDQMARCDAEITKLAETYRDKVYDIYLRNALIISTTEVQLFNQFELSNRYISEGLHQQWAGALGNLLVQLKGHLRWTVAVPETIRLPELDERQRKGLPNLDLDDYPDVLVEAELAAALGTILTDGHGTRPSAKACNLSLFLVNYADRSTGKIKLKLNLERSQQIRWKQLVAVVAERVASSCSWTDRRAGKQDVPETAVSD